jgi:MFS family permease
VPWLCFKPTIGYAEAKANGDGPSAMEILRQRNFWAVSAGHFFSNYPLYFLIVWLPLYLVQERHLTMQKMAIVGTLYYLAFAIMAPISGWIADACIRAGGDVTMVRKTCMAVGHGVVVVGVLAAGSADPRIYIAGLIVMGLGSGCIGPNIYVYAQTLAGPAVAGKWMGFQNGIGNLAGVVVGPLTGWIVDRTGHFAAGFTICAVTPLLAGIFWVLLVGRVEPTAWVAKAEVLQAAGEAA